MEEKQFFCPGCGSPLKDSFEFCPYCGAQNPNYNPEVNAKKKLQAAQAKLEETKLNKEVVAAEREVALEKAKDDPEYAKMKREYDDLMAKRPKNIKPFLIAGIVLIAISLLFLIVILFNKVLATQYGLYEYLIIIIIPIILGIVLIVLALLFNKSNKERQARINDLEKEMHYYMTYRIPNN